MTPEAKANDTKPKHIFVKSLILVCLFYIYANIFLLSAFVALFIMSLLVLCIVSTLIWDRTKKIQSTLKISFFSLILIAIFFDLFRLKPYEHDFYKRESSDFKLKENKTVDFNIIFVETNLNRVNVSFKANCAIESAAYNNANANVMVFSLQTNINERLLDEYKNIKVYKSSVDQLFNNTPLYDWFKEKNAKILNSQFSIEHLADALRLALLYQHGGIYSDLDTITIRNLNPLKNFTGVGYLGETINTKFQPSIGNGFLVFPERQHKMLYQAMELFTKSYNPKGWASNGPTLLKKVIQTYCQVNNIYETLMLESSNKTSSCDISILPERYFYPYSWENLSELFENNTTINIRKITDSYSVHFYGKMSKNKIIRPGDNSVYEYFAKHNCPISYQFL